MPPARDPRPQTPAQALHRAFGRRVRVAAGGGPVRDGPVVGVFEFDEIAPGLGAVHFALAASCWGRGFATEALGAVVDRAFTPSFRRVGEERAP